MVQSGKSSKKTSSLAAKVLGGSKKATRRDAKRLAGSVLTQAPNRRKGK